MAQLPIARGKLITINGEVVLVVTCPLCGATHRYAKGEPGGESVRDLRAAGFSEEWLPCQRDLPGNFIRITFGENRRHRPSPRRDVA